MFILYVCSLTLHSRIVFLYGDREGRVNTIEFQLVKTHEGNKKIMGMLISFFRAGKRLPIILILCGL